MTSPIKCNRCGEPIPVDDATAPLRDLCTRCQSEPDDSQSDAPDARASEHVARDPSSHQDRMVTRSMLMPRPGIQTEFS